MRSLSIGVAGAIGGAAGGLARGNVTPSDSAIVALMTFVFTAAIWFVGGILKDRIF
ncbi:hypothetical protein [Sphingomonas immobilis]|uniref:Uncharacterized protein n=1 Tax=Sphingomonas immobilis TaxID=3063997 RepID=A0ABT9A1Y3_9SPHN|nr:hypothetical protein [Sphingomonas sp. CA1-15]MDO7843839.1 hypothetical protein [Sphingomonas sp. CA1-15]